MRPQIQKMDEPYFHKLSTNEKYTLQDAQTRLPILALEDMYIVTVDQGIIQDKGPGSRKCDYLSYCLDNSYTHLIELKGKEISEALLQLEYTLDNIPAKSSYQELVTGRDRIDAYIVSPDRQNIPVGIDSRERKLTRKLAARSRKRVDDLSRMLYYVRVVPKCKNNSASGNRIQCSGQAPLQLV